MDTIKKMLNDGLKPKVKQPDTLNEIGQFLKEKGTLNVASIFIAGMLYKSIPYPENKTFFFKDRKSADNFINSLNTKK